MATKRKTQAAVKPAPAAAVKLASLRATKAAQLSPGTRENIQRGRTVAHLLWLKLVATISPEARELLFMFNGLVKDYEDVFPADVELSVPAFHPVSVAEQLERAEHLLTGFDREMIRRDESGRLAQRPASAPESGLAQRACELSIDLGQRVIGPALDQHPDLRAALSLQHQLEDIAGTERDRGDLDWQRGRIQEAERLLGQGGAR